jgi:tetratricopeptide (TPR) repeat protein
MHISRDELRSVFSFTAESSEIRDAVAHIAACPPCLDRAADVVAALRESGDLAPTGRGRPPEDRYQDGRAALIALMDVREQKRMGVYRAKAWWDELKELSPKEQAGRVKATAAIQKKEVFETIIHESSRFCGRDPFAAEHLATSALLLVDHLPSLEFPDRVKNGLRLAAMSVVANSRRLAGNWSGAFTAISEARRYQAQGKTRATDRAFLLSVHGALVCDTGKLEEALDIFGQAASIYRKEQNYKGLATVKIQQADALFGAGKVGDALEMAEAALGLLRPENARLELSARSIITECLIVLGRLSEATSSYEATEHLYDMGGDLVYFKAEYLEAKLLDARGHARESEKAFVRAIDGVTELEAYRLSILFRFALFESLFKRSAFGKCARLCEETIELLEQPGTAHSQMPQVWKDLLAAVQAEILKECHLAEMRRYLARHWAVPAARVPVFALAMGV